MTLNYLITQLAVVYPDKHFENNVMPHGTNVPSTLYLTWYPRIIEPLGSPSPSNTSNLALYVDQDFRLSLNDIHKTL